MEAAILVGNHQSDGDDNNADPDNNSGVDDGDDYVDEINLNSIILGECEVLVNRDLSIVGRVSLIKKTCHSWGIKQILKYISNIRYLR